MDWFTIALIFIFLVLPLIQQFLEHARKGKELPPVEMEEEAAGEMPMELGEHEAPAPRPAEPVELDEEDRGWSTGWGQWPGMEVEVEEAEAEVEEDVRDEIDLVWAPVPQRPTPPRIEVPRAERPRHEPAVESRPRPPRPARMAREVSVEPRRPPTRSPLARSLADIEGVRRAVVLSEVLGPPVMLRPRHPHGVDPNH